MMNPEDLAAARHPEIVKARERLVDLEAALAASRASTRALRADNKVSIEEATAVLGLLAMLDGRRAKPAAHALAGLLDSRTLLPAAEVLMKWARTVAD